MNENQKIELGQKIKAARKAKKMTQVDLADKIGKTESSIRKYENGTVLIPTDIIQSIANALDVSPFTLMGAEYWDAKLPEVSAVVSRYELFVEYLKSLGYSVLEESEPAVIPAELIPEKFKDEVNSESCLIGETCHVTLKNDGITAEFTQEEFEALQNRTKDFIEGMILLQGQKNKK